MHALNEATSEGAHGGEGARRRRACARRRQGCAQGRRRGRGARRRRQGAAWPTPMRWRMRSPSRSPHLIVSLAGPYDNARRGSDDDGQERHAARRGAPRRDAGLRRDGGDLRRTRSAGRPMPATPSRRCSRRTRRRSSPSAPSAFAAAASGGAAAPIEDGRGAGRCRAFRVRRGRLSRRRAPRARFGEDHHLGRARARLEGEVHGGHPADRRQARRRGRRHRARPSMRAMRRTTGRSARPARSSRPTSTSPAAFRARSSTLPG